jgi:hypothetical protein
MSKSKPISADTLELLKDICEIKQLDDVEQVVGVGLPSHSLKCLSRGEMLPVGETGIKRHPRLRNLFAFGIEVVSHCSTYKQCDQ